MSLGFVLTAVANVLTFVSAAIYFRGILSGKTVPHVFSWLVWTIVTGTGFFAQLAGGGGIGAWVTGFTMLFTASVTGYAIFRGSRQIACSDIITLSLAIMAIGLWVITRNPLDSVILISIIELLAFYPTFRKSWHKPFDEPLRVYLFGAVGALLALFAMENFTWTTALFPAVTVIDNVVFVATTAWRRRVHALKLAG